MENTLDYYDIQGNIMVNYAEHGFLKARYLFLTITDVDKGRAFVKSVAELITPTSQFMSAEKVISLKAATNISFSYNGLKRLGLPVLTLQSFPDEFIVGMRGRRIILGDDNQSNPEHWDPVWSEEDVHIFVSIDARDQPAIDDRYRAILAMVNSSAGGVRLLDGHRSQDASKTLEYQDVSALYENGLPTPKEHFGYSDGISNPFFKGMTEDMGNLLGGGKRVGYGDSRLESSWLPIEAGEFILGYKDEAQEYPFSPTPPLMGRNGSFLVYNKFHEHVDRFDAYLKKEGAKFPGGEEALAAKFVGRWRNGAPLTTFPKKEEADEIALERQKAIAQMITAAASNDPQLLQKAQANFKEINKSFIAFDYDNDIEGSKCPVGAHTRRANPRGSLEFGNKNAFDTTPAALDNRRRMIRRGLPYGVVSDRTLSGGEHGTIIMTIVASIKRQFEFVVQQWLNYGNDFKLANDRDPIMGNHKTVDGVGSGRMIIEGHKDGNDPYFLSGIPRFIETRGGEYFFIPSLTALRLIGEGIVDPT